MINLKFKINNLKFSSGFTLIEVIISVAIFSLLIGGIVALASNILVSSGKQSTLLNNTDQARKAAFKIINQLRNAQTAASGAYPISTAGAQQLIFYSDTGTEVDRINYYIQNGVLKMGITRPVANAYNLATETVTTVQNDLGNGANPVFLYYGDTYNGVTGNALTQPVNVTAVKFIKVNITVYNKAGVTGTATYTISAGGAVRNLKTNLGS